MFTTLQLLILAGDLILPGDELIPKLVAETEGTLSEFSQSVLLLAIVSKLEPSVWCKDPKLTQFVVRSSLEHWNRWYEIYHGSICIFLHLSLTY